jgi:hypothetical protein
MFLTVLAVQRFPSTNPRDAIVLASSVSVMLGFILRHHRYLAWMGWSILMLHFWSVGVLAWPVLLIVFGCMFVPAPRAPKLAERGRNKPSAS